ncbi:MAG: hypothetical protein PHO56_00675 [Patescibacteria group bacterium]|nr:hypothetical protein [Patescibacteria group bacterium]
MKTVLLMIFLVTLAIAGDKAKQSGITELCWMNSDSTFSFSLELVNILSKSEAKGRYTFYHRDGRATIIYYDAKTQVFRVVKNFVSVPPADSSANKAVIVDPVTGKPAMIEWQ